MKKLTILFLAALTLVGRAQSEDPSENQPAREAAGNLAAGLGLVWIDEEPHYAMRLTPDFSFGKIGLGFDLNLEFNAQGELREENFNDVGDYLGVIRYVRYGVKNDPIYGQIGQLSHYTLGYGNMVFAYNNMPSFDEKAVGLALDIDFDEWGFESMYSDFSEAGVVGARGYARPVKMALDAPIPIVSDIEVGASFAGDLSSEHDATLGVVDSTGAVTIVDEASPVRMIGFDIGVPIVSLPMTEITLYSAYTNIFDYGNGLSTGLMFEFSGLGLVNVAAKLERRFNGDQYIPSYFDAFYEIDKFRVNQETNTLHTKTQELLAATNAGNGFYGELIVGVLGTFDVLGSYQRLDDHPKSGQLRLWTEIAPEDAPFVARAGYDKKQIADETDMFTLDDRSLLTAEVGYKPIPYLLFSIVFQQNYTPVRDEDDEVVGYEPQKRIEPRVSFMMPF